VNRADTKIVDEAKERFTYCEEWETQFRTNYKNDMKFAEGDSYNGWQWTASYVNDRNKEGAPSLTINKVRQHNLQIVNDARQNKPQIRIQPVADGASKEAALVFEGVCRHIEYISDAQTAYDTATYHQVYGGIGYLRIVTEYPDTESFDQEIYIRRVHDPLSVYLDPDIQMYDGSDARYAFIFKNMRPKQFDDKYPKWKGRVGYDVLGADDDWSNKENVRVAEYFRRSDINDALMEMPANLHPDMPQGGMVKRSEITPEWASALDEMKVRSRPIKQPKIEWYKIAGDQIIERGVWPGSYIPIARVVGEETIIDGRLDRKGHTRALMDAQRMYNYWSSSAVEHVALQTKTPWVGPMETFEEFGQYYENANLENRAFLPHKSYDDQNRKLDQPTKVMPPVMPNAYMQGMETAANELLMASGQYQAEMGEPGNERSGTAINARQRQSDNATYHYVDHLSQSIRYLGRQLIDLIPHIYDTPRVLRILGEDGTEKHVKLDPNAKKAIDGDLDHPTDADVGAIFNPNIGKYDVVADIGPAYATKRQEAFSGYLQIMQRSPDLMAKAGDIFFSQSDMPGAEALADRLQKFLPPQILDEKGPDPQVLQLQQQMQTMHQAATQTLQQAGQQVKDLQQQLADKQHESDRKDAEVKLKMAQMHFDQVQATTTARFNQQLEEYKAQTARMAAAAAADPAMMKVLLRELGSHVVQMPIVPLMKEHAVSDQEMQPEPETTTTNGKGQAA